MLSVFYNMPLRMASPSMRREWIEMSLLIIANRYPPVSLHAEGVD